jgi:plastocyanin
MSRGTAVVSASLALGLLGLPPALSAAQQGADPAAAPQPAAGQDTGATGPAGPDGGSSPGTGEAAPDDWGQGSSEPPAEPATGGGPVVRGAQASAPAARFAASMTVSIGDNFYSPKSVSIDVGDTVTWVNNGQAQHSATASDGSFDTGIFGPGGRRSHTFNQAGSFDYYCLVHGTAQSGTIAVAASGGGGASAAGGGGAGSGGGGSGPSEASAVASSEAAGNSSSLPATGSNPLPPLLVGVALLLAGLGLRLRTARG